MKQENRIRALEAKVNAAAGDETDARNSNKNGSGAAAPTAAAESSSSQPAGSESANDHSTAKDKAHEED